MNKPKNPETTIETPTLSDYENDSETIGMYAFYDLKSKRYDTPFFAQSDLFAGRHYKMVVEKPGTMINQFRDDFDLHRIGFYDLEDGTIVEFRECIITGKLANKPQEDKE